MVLLVRGSSRIKTSPFPDQRRKPWGHELWVFGYQGNAVECFRPSNRIWKLCRSRYRQAKKFTKHAQGSPIISWMTFLFIPTRPTLGSMKVAELFGCGYLGVRFLSTTAMHAAQRTCSLTSSQIDQGLFFVLDLNFNIYKRAKTSEP